jgi:enterochelin esterase-like enzyme
MSEETKFESPRLRELDEQLQAGNYEVVEAFWKEIEAEGTPLFEDIEDDETQVLATFLYKGDGATENVLLRSEIIAGETLKDYKMTQMPYSKIWYRSVPVRKDILTTYAMPVNDSLIELKDLKTDEERIARIKSLYVSDPLNPNTFHFPKNPDDPEDFELTMSMIKGSDAAPQPHVEKRKKVKRGKVENFDIESKLLDNTRKIWVYTPHGYKKNSKKSYPLLLAFDGFTYVEIVPTPTLLDNLIDEGKIPPMIAVIVGNAKEQRGKELPPNETFSQFIREELLPFVKKDYKISDNPDENVVAGSSYGGIAATWAGFKLSDIFGNVISQSGSYWWYPAMRDTDNSDADKEPGWLIRQFVESEKLPLRFYMDIGILENSPSKNWGSSHHAMNRHMRDVLRAKGYPLHYVEYSGAHDYIWWRQTLADGLIALQEMKQKK